jgi:hypothetical protein
VQIKYAATRNCDLTLSLTASPIAPNFVTHRLEKLINHNLKKKTTTTVDKQKKIGAQIAINYGKIQYFHRIKCKYLQMQHNYFLWNIIHII